MTLRCKYVALVKNINDLLWLRENVKHNTGSTCLYDMHRIDHDCTKCILLDVEDGLINEWPVGVTR